jgi:hypothetical protein
MGGRLIVPNCVEFVSQKSKSNVVFYYIQPSEIGVLASHDNNKQTSPNVYAIYYKQDMVFQNKM